MKTGRLMGLFGAMLLAGSMGADFPKFRGFNYSVGGYNPTYYPKRTKFKGWMRERRRCSFNKKK